MKVAVSLLNLHMIDSKLISIGIIYRRY